MLDIFYKYDVFAIQNGGYIFIGDLAILNYIFYKSSFIVGTNNRRKSLYLFVYSQAYRNWNNYYIKRQKLTAFYQI